MATATGLIRILETTEEHVLIVAAEGDLDFQTAPDLCARLTTRRGGRIVVDLSRLHFCDSSGLRAIIGEAREAAAAGGRHVIVAPGRGAVRRLFDLTGLVEVIDVVEGRAEAMARLKALR